MTSIQEAQGQWQVIRSRGRIKGLIALLVVVVVLLVVAIAAGGSAGIAVGVIAAVALVVFAVTLFVGQRRTGVSITPEWAPKESPTSSYDDEDDEDEDDDGDVPAAAGSGAPVDTERSEPVRAVDGQMLGSELEALGQTVTPKLAKSYALGTIALGEGAVTWTPSSVSAGQGITALSAAAASIAAVERAPLWGSWALLRVELRVGGAWVFRIPSSVDLAPALTELGITFRQVTPTP